MRPINLTFWGLNSYAKKQDIDFERLTQTGLFGIFGPTGSGKSTILDAITIALYGSVARKSKEYLNTNCDELYVSYTFRLSSQGGYVDYTAERRFTRSKDTGNVRAKHVRFIKHDDGDEILSEKTTDMNNQIIDLLGLTMDDFTRSVVLPQGQFSSFLKLKAADRRNMLERIFGLEKYGLQLGAKLKSAYGEVHSKQQYIKGQLDRYEDFSGEGLKELEKDLGMQELAYEELLKDLSAVEEEYRKASELCTMQVELKGYQNTQKDLELKKPIIDEKQLKLQRGEKSALIKPVLDDIKEDEKAISASEAERLEINKQLLSHREEQVNYGSKLKKVEEFETIQLPQWLELKGRYVEAVGYQQSLSPLQGRFKELSISKESLVHKMTELKEHQNILQNQLLTKQELLGELDEQVKSCSVDSDYRQMIEKGYLLENRKVELTQHQLGTQQRIEALTTRIAKGNALQDELAKELAMVMEQQKVAEEVEKALLDKKPLTIQEISKLQEDVHNLKKKLELLSEAEVAIEKALVLCQELEKAIKIKEEALKEILRQEEQLKHQKEEAEQLFEQQREQSIAAMLAKELEQGEACPVCGSTHHVELATFEEQKGDEDLKDQIKRISQQLLVLEGKKQEVNLDILSKKQEVLRLEKELSEKRELLKNEDIDGLTVELRQNNKMLEEAHAYRDQWDKDRDEVAHKLKKLLEEYNLVVQKKGKTEEGLTHLKGQLEEAKEKQQSYEKELQDIDASLLDLIKDYKLTSFSEEKNNITTKDQQLKEVTIRKDREEKEKVQYQTEYDGSVTQLNKIDIDLASLTKEWEFTGKEIKELQHKIESICGKEVSPDVALKELEDKTHRYIEGAKKVRTKVQAIEDAINKTLVLLAQNEAKTKQLVESKEKKFLRAEEQRVEYNFLSMEEVLGAFIDTASREILAKEIKDYEEEVTKVGSSIHRLNEKIGTASIEEDAYKALGEKKDSVSWKRDYMLKLKSETSTKVEQYKKAMDEVGDLIKEKDVIDHRLNMLEDLRNLVKGNRFVEYVAQNQFHYIVNEASIRLYELTGRYGLALDESNEFRIRDDKNGGALREAATLSGGETFLTSLALALALSSHIQLKGSYPLEFFFLDEGFGTLDTELLDVVMTSLEKLNSTHMNVGIISHVEELKNRVPVKLVIKPSELGGDGSSIKLEYS